MDTHGTCPIGLLFSCQASHGRGPGGAPQVLSQIPRTSCRVGTARKTIPSLGPGTYSRNCPESATLHYRGGPVLKSLGPDRGCRINPRACLCSVTGERQRKKSQSCCLPARGVQSPPPPAAAKRSWLPPRAIGCAPPNPDRNRIVSTPLAWLLPGPTGERFSWAKLANWENPEKPRPSPGSRGPGPWETGGKAGTPAGGPFFWRTRLNFARPFRQNPPKRSPFHASKTRLMERIYSRTAQTDRTEKTLLT